MIFFTSDTHFNHANVIEFCDRPYDSVEQMNEDMVDKWNSVVGPNDIVYHLGDVGLGNASKYEKYIRALNGYRVLVIGNHDNTKQKMLDIGFHRVCDQDYVQVQDGPTAKVLWLAHIPSFNESDKRKLERPEPIIEYDLELCGHVHTGWTVNVSDDLTKYIVNVGVDVHGMTPISVGTVLRQPTLVI